MKMNFDMQSVEWKAIDPVEVEGDVAYATHAGIWNFMGDTLRVYKLSNDHCVIHADDFERAFGPMFAALR